MGWRPGNLAVLDLDEVNASWIVASGKTPLIVVIALSALIGCGSAESRAVPTPEVRVRSELLEP